MTATNAVTGAGPRATEARLLAGSVVLTSAAGILLGWSRSSELSPATLVTGVALAVIAIVFSFATTYASYQFGIDPDDTTIPIVTNVVDVFGMVIFIGVSTLVLG